MGEINKLKAAGTFNKCRHFRMEKLVNKFLSYAQTLFDNRKLKVSDKLRKLILFKATLDGFKLTRIKGLIMLKHNTSDF